MYAYILHMMYQDSMNLPKRLQLFSEFMVHS